MLRLVNIRRAILELTCRLSRSSAPSEDEVIFIFISLAYPSGGGGGGGNFLVQMISTCLRYA